MKCPYCMSDVHDKAIVCPICTRDLLFVTPILKRVDELESDLASFITKVQDVKLEITRPETRREAAISKVVQAAKVTFFYLIQSITLILLAGGYPIVADMFLFWGYPVVNLLYGLGCSYSRPHESRRYYLVIGVLLAVVDMSVRGSAYHWTPVECIAFFVSDILWFWTGSEFGRTLRRWATHGPTQSAQGFPLASIIGSTSDEATPKVADRQERLRETVKLLTPLAVSIVSTVISTMVKK